MMIYSANPEPPECEFTQILENSTCTLYRQLKEDAHYYEKINAASFEEDVYAAMVESAKHTRFEGSIELVSGQRFPDIIAHGYYGVEVKTTQRNHWQTIGNSVLESTRVNGIEKIYLFFGKLANPIGFKYRKYQDCLADVAITHSPRYTIDMELADGQSIFDKMNISYDEIRKLAKPISPIIKYYKSILGNNSVWWLNGDEEETAERAIPMNIRNWIELGVEEQNKIKGEVFFLFPEIFGSNQYKYKRAVAWLTKDYGVVSSSFRDLFSAGGQVELVLNGQTFFHIPRIIKTLLEHKPYFQNAISHVPLYTLMEYYPLEKTYQDSASARFELWGKHFRDNIQDKSIPVDRIIMELHN